MQITSGGNIITAPITGLTTGDTNACKVVAVDKTGNESEPYEINVATKLYTWEKYNVDETTKLSWTKITQGFQYILAIDWGETFECYTSIQNAVLRDTSISRNLVTEDGTGSYIFVKPDSENEYDDQKGWQYTLTVNGNTKLYYAMEPWSFKDHSFLGEFRLVKLGAKVWTNQSTYGTAGWTANTTLYNIDECYKRNTFRNRKSKRNFSRDTTRIQFKL